MTNLRTMTLMNGSGDLTLSWDESSDDEMIAFIEDKLSQGYIFFTVERTEHFWGLIKRDRKKSIDDMKAAIAGRNMVMSDKKDELWAQRRLKDIHDHDAQRLVAKGEVAVTQTPKADNVTCIRGLRDAKEIAKSDSVMIRQVTGG